MPATAASCGRAPASRRAAINVSAGVRTLTTTAWAHAEPDDYQAKAAGDDLLRDLGAAAGTRGITDAAEAASLKPTCIADDRADASEDVFRRHARSVNVPPGCLALAA